jgi:predicted O-linked N-acetylglucosamine transferase (SPINDLY family)
MKSATRTQAALEQGLALHHAGRLNEARACYQKALRWQPQNPDALHLLGLIALQSGQPDRAVELIGKALGADPGNAAARYNLGCAQSTLGRNDAAIASFDAAIALKSDYAEAHHNRGSALHALQRYEAAIASYDQAIALQPGYADAYYSRGVTLCELQRYEAAIASYDAAIALRADYAAAYNNRGVVLAHLGRYEAAVASYDQAIALRPDYVEAYANRGSALYELHQYHGAIASYERVIERRPDDALAHDRRGAALADLRQYAAAIVSYEHAIALKPDFAEACNHRGNALQELLQYEAAIASYEQAIALDAAFADPYYNRGVALAKLGRHESALLNFTQAIALKPGIRFLYGMRLLSRLQICDWTELDADLAQLTALIERGEPAAAPFAVLVALDLAALQEQAARILVRELFPPDQALGAIPKRSRPERLRIGYFSADFHNHATLHLMAGLFEMHDRSRFECTAFSFGTNPQDAMRRRLVAACEHFIDVRDKSDHEVALLSRERQIDIAVDLKGFTAGHRTGIFALRAAPLQLSYLGYPGTMGAPYIDYLIADRTLVPEGSECYYSEQIIYLPDSYQINDSARPTAACEQTREHCGLPAAGVVFCCFNNCYKITPGMFDRWMRILNRVEGSVLWLLEDNAAATRNLQRAARRRGVDAERVLFAPRLALPEHLARQSLADLFLDTLPCNAHTTASDALWAGLPVITCAGEGFAARVAASLLEAIQLPELIAATPVHYEQLAIALASDPQRLARIRQRLAAQRLTAPLFNTRLSTRHLETAYSEIYERYQAGSSPAHIDVQR